MRIILIVLLILFQKGALGQIRKLSVESTIQNVTIFSSGARVERIGSVSVVPGRSEITFSGLSNQLDQQSVQLQADASITLLSVQATKDYLHKKIMEQEEKDYLERMTTLEEKISQDNKQLEVLKQEEDMLIKNQAIGGQAGVKTPELKVAMDFQKQRFAEIFQQEMVIQRRLASEKRELDDLKAQRMEISKKRDSVNYLVTALIDSKETKNIKFRLLYNIKEAGWYPTYDVRLIEVNQPLEILMNANVFQRSGETWKDISLMLSSGSPNDNSTPSSLEPWMLNYYDPSIAVRSISLKGTITGRMSNEKGEPIAGATIQLKNTRTATISDANGYFKFSNYNSGDVLIFTAVGYEQKTVTARSGYFSVILSPSIQNLNEVVVVGYSKKDLNGALQGEVAGLATKEERNIQTVNIATQYQPTTTIYKIEDKYTIETDSKTTTIGIKHFDLPAIYEYLTIPKIDPTTFLSAKILNWQDYDLQSGEASLYFEGSYLGKTYMDLSSVADTLSLSLGKDNSIKVSRKLIKEYTQKKFFGSNRTESRQYEISIKNTKRIPVTITVKDQIPVSANKDISIEEVEAQDAQIEKGSGIATWIISLEPGKEKKLLINFSVKYPRDRKIILE